MKNLYYNLDTDQARHYASLAKGDKMVLVVSLKEQPPKGSSILHIDDKVYFEYPYGDVVGYDFPYPLNSRIGLRETWEWLEGYNLGEYWYVYKVDGKPNVPEWQGNFKWHSSQCQPIEAIRHWATVMELRVDRVQEVFVCEWYRAGFPDTTTPAEIKGANWFNRRYKGKWTWEQNPYCQIVTIEKE